MNFDLILVDELYYRVANYRDIDVILRSEPFKHKYSISVIGGKVNVRIFCEIAGSHDISIYINGIFFQMVKITVSPGKLKFRISLKFLNSFLVTRTSIYWKNCK